MGGGVEAEYAGRTFFGFASHFNWHNLAENFIVSRMCFAFFFFLPCLGMCCCKTRTNTHSGVFQSTQTQFVNTNRGPNKTVATHIIIIAVVIVSGQRGKHLLLFASYLPPLDRPPTPPSRPRPRPRLFPLVLQTLPALRAWMIRSTELECQSLLS